jgi:hypothetical protein
MSEVLQDIVPKMVTWDFQASITCGILVKTKATSKLTRCHEVWPGEFYARMNPTHDAARFPGKSSVDQPDTWAGRT